MGGRGDPISVYSCYGEVGAREGALGGGCRWAVGAGEGWERVPNGSLRWIQSGGLSSEVGGGMRGWVVVAGRVEVGAGGPLQR